MRFEIPILIQDGECGLFVYPTEEEAEKAADEQDDYGYTNAVQTIELEYKDGQLLYHYSEWNPTTFTFEDKFMVFQPIAEPS